MSAGAPGLPVIGGGSDVDATWRGITQFSGKPRDIHIRTIGSNRGGVLIICGIVADWVVTKLSPLFVLAATENLQDL